MENKIYEKYLGIYTSSLKKADDTRNTAIDNIANLEQQLAEAEASQTAAINTGDKTRYKSAKKKIEDLSVDLAFSKKTRDARESDIVRELLTGAPEAVAALDEELERLSKSGQEHIENLLEELKQAVSYNFVEITAVALLRDYFVERVMGEKITSITYKKGDAAKKYIPQASYKARRAICNESDGRKEIFSEFSYPELDSVKDSLEFVTREDMKRKQKRDEEKRSAQERDKRLNAAIAERNRKLEEHRQKMIQERLQSGQDEEGRIKYTEVYGSNKPWN